MSSDPEVIASSLNGLSVKGLVWVTGGESKRSAGLFGIFCQSRSAAFGRDCTDV
jgi:hypothetical protein